MKNIDLTKGRVGKVLLSLALPIMGSSLLQFTYNLIDMLFVGGLGSDAVASIGSSSFFIGLGNSISALIMIGTSIKVAHSVGKEEVQEMKDYIRAGIQLSLILGLIYGSVLIFFGKSFIGFLQMNNTHVEYEAYHYLIWSAPMLVFSFLNALFSRVFASLGNTKKALYINIIGIGINIILDPILIYVVGWGVVGAAIGTLIANVVMFIFYLKVGKEILSFSFKYFAFDKIKEIIKLGIPIAFQRILFTLINIILAKLIAGFGSDAVAAQKIALQIEAVTYMVTGGLNGGVASFTGQNYGAKKYDRLQRGYYSALTIGLAYAALSAAIFWFIPKELAGMFVKEVETISIAASYLRIIAYSQIFNAMEMVSNGFFTGIGKPKIPAFVSVIFTALRLPMAYILTDYLGLDGIWWSITLSTALKGTVLMGIYCVKTRKLSQYNGINKF